jgi:hypothetical protein
VNVPSSQTEELTNSDLAFQRELRQGSALSVSQSNGRGREGMVQHGGIAVNVAGDGSWHVGGFRWLLTVNMCIEA